MLEQYLDKLISAKNVKEKEQLLEQAWKAEVFDLFTGFQLCFDKFSHYDISPPRIVDLDDEPDNLGMAKFQKLATQLNNKQKLSISLDDAINLSSVNLWNTWYSHILEQSLSIVSPATVNRVLSKISRTDLRAMKYTIPVFGFQTAYMYDHQNLSGKMFVDAWIPGDRQIVILNKERSEIQCYSNKGKLIPFVHNLSPLLEHMPISVVLDCIATDIKTYIIDSIPFSDFKRGFCKLSQDERHLASCSLQDAILELTNRKISVLPKKLIQITDSKSLDLVSEDFRAQGITKFVVKDSMAPYLFRKSNSWLQIQLD